MNLPELHPEVFFPDSIPTTPFGWDPVTFPEAPRIHHAVDRAGAGVVSAPFAASRVAWVDQDAQGNSVLRLFAGPLELRMLHFRKAELAREVLSAVEAGTGLPAGQPLAPAGDVGIGTGRHLHYQFMLTPVEEYPEIDELAPGWLEDDSGKMRERYGMAFVREVAARSILWINERALCRRDPWTGKLRLIIDSAGILGL